MIVSLIAAVASNRVIGDRGRIPWRLPDDLAQFRGLTMGHPVIMGRATYESLGRPLRGRPNIVVTRSPAWRAEGCIVVHSVEEAQEAAHAARLAQAAAARRGPGAADGPGTEEVFVIGGASIYGLFLPTATRMYITWIDAAVSGDTLFPDVDWSQWRLTQEEIGPSSPLPHRFADYVRTSG